MFKNHKRAQIGRGPPNSHRRNQVVLGIRGGKADGWRKPKGTRSVQSIVRRRTQVLTSEKIPSLPEVIPTPEDGPQIFPESFSIRDFSSLYPSTMLSIQQQRSASSPFRPLDQLGETRPFNPNSFTFDVEAVHPLFLNTGAMGRSSAPILYCDADSIMFIRQSWSSSDNSERKENVVRSTDHDQQLADYCDDPDMTFTRLYQLYDANPQSIRELFSKRAHLFAKFSPLQIVEYVWYDCHFVRTQTPNLAEMEMLSLQSDSQREAQFKKGLPNWSNVPHNLSRVALLWCALNNKCFYSILPRPFVYPADKPLMQHVTELSLQRWNSDPDRPLRSLGLNLWSYVPPHLQPVTHTMVPVNGKGEYDVYLMASMLGLGPEWMYQGGYEHFIQTNPQNVGRVDTIINPEEAVLHLRDYTHRVLLNTFELNTNGWLVSDMYSPFGVYLGARPNGPPHICTQLGNTPFWSLFRNRNCANGTESATGEDRLADLCRDPIISYGIWNNYVGVPLSELADFIQHEVDGTIANPFQFQADQLKSKYELFTQLNLTENTLIALLRFCNSSLDLLGNHPALEQLQITTALLAGTLLRLSNINVQLDQLKIAYQQLTASNQAQVKTWLTWLMRIGMIGRWWVPDTALVYKYNNICSIRYQYLVDTKTSSPAVRLSRDKVVAVELAEEPSVNQWLRTVPVFRLNTNLEAVGRRDSTFFEVLTLVRAGDFCLNNFSDICLSVGWKLLHLLDIPDELECDIAQVEWYNEMDPVHGHRFVQ